jgi:hypothetical protein
MTKSGKLLIILLVTLLVGGVFYYQQLDNAEDTATANTEQSSDNETPLEPSPTLLSQLQKSTETEEASLKAVDGSDSSGMAYRLFENGKFKHAVVADMPEPAPGSVYEGWLVQPDPLNFFSTGVMEKNEEGLWVLEFTANQAYPDYFRVVITEETIVDEIPEIHIIEGDF